jgi:hypothetical protein
MRFILTGTPWLFCFTIGCLWIYVWRPCFWRQVKPLFRWRNAPYVVRVMPFTLFVDRRIL